VIRQYAFKWVKHGQVTLNASTNCGDFARYALDSILDADDADHLRLRKLVSRTFTARRVSELRPRVEEITEDLLDRLVATARTAASASSH
jgi:cytochrome P450